MRTYEQVPEDAEYREYYDSYRKTVNNLNEEDFLFKSNLSNGQLYFDTDGRYGLINGHPARRNRNLNTCITANNINNTSLQDFIIYDRRTNDFYSLNINVNFSQYWDNKPHYLYVGMTHGGTWEIHDDMFQSDERLILFARFYITTSGVCKQFFMMLPFAGSADYLKGNQFYQVTEGLRVTAVPTTKQLMVSKAKIRYSAINFDDFSSPDCLTIDNGNNVLNIRYLRWDSTDGVPRVPWNNDESITTYLDTTKIMSYHGESAGQVSDLPTDHFSLQKVYYDIYTNTLCILYGEHDYETRIDAIYGIDSILNYPLPDGMEYLIPVAVLIISNTLDDLDDTNFRIVNLDYNEKEVLDSDTFTRQQSAEAMFKSREALEISRNTQASLTSHLADKANPHQVKLNQLLTSTGEAAELGDDFQTYNTVQKIHNRTMQAVAGLYLPLAGGTITGNLTVNQVLTVASTSNLKATNIDGKLTMTGNIEPSANLTYNLGSSAVKFNNIYVGTTNTGTLNSGAATLTGLLTSRNLVPNATNLYDIGENLKRYATLYAGKANLTDGIVMGNYTLRIGSTGSIPTTYGFAITKD